MAQMMKQIPVFIVLFIGFSLITASPIQAQLVDTTAWWLIVSPDTDARAQSNLDSLVSVLKERGGILPKQIHRIEGNECTHNGIKIALDSLARRMGQGDRLIFYFRGFVTKPRRSNSIFFLTYGAPSENLANALKDRQLNRWFHELSRNSVIVILDTYTRDRNLMAFYANRELLGAGAFISIQRAALSDEDLFAQNLLVMLKNDATDLDDNRQISIAELHRRLNLTISEDSASRLTDGILVPTGEFESTVLKLSPMLKVVSVPDGASVFLSKQEIGTTPQRLIDNLDRGTYQVEVRKPGYLIPRARSVQIELVQGEAINLSWDLESIVVYGRVKVSDGVPLEGATVSVDGTEYERNSRRLGADAQYRLPANITHVVFGEGRSDTKVLAPGKAYTLRAESGDLYYAAAVFTLAPHESLQRDLILTKKTWFEVAQMRFNRKAHEGAIAAFQNGIEETTDFPPMSPEFTKMLFDSFSAVVKRVDVQNIAYIVTTAKLADTLNLWEESKVYWTQVKLKAAKGSPEYQLATKRLGKLNFGNRLINIGVFVVLIGVLVSGAYLFQKARKAREQID